MKFTPSFSDAFFSLFPCQILKNEPYFLIHFHKSKFDVISLARSIKINKKVHENKMGAQKFIFHWNKVILSTLAILQL